MNKNVETFIGADSIYEDAKMVIFGAPFDATTSFRPGTRFGSKAIRSDSFGIETYSPYQDLDLLDTAVFDAGDLELAFGSPEKALAQIEEMTTEILCHGKMPIMLGGEHLVSLAMARALVKQYPDLAIVHFDAHADLRDDYLGEKLSHACVMRRIWELVGDDRIFQFGIRSGDRTEFVWGKDHVQTQKFNFDHLTETVQALGNRPIYVTLDLDILDPSIFPGTGTPEAGGVTFNEILAALMHLKPLHVVAFDLNELSPVYDQSGVSTAVACKLLREMILLWAFH